MFVGPVNQSSLVHNPCWNMRRTPTDEAPPRSLVVSRVLPSPWIRSAVVPTGLVVGRGC